MGLLDTISGGADGSMGLLGSVLSRIDAMKRRAGGLLSADGVNQVLASIAEDARANANLAGQGLDNAHSVMPDVAQQGTQQLMQAGMPGAMGLMTVYHGSPHVFDKFDMSKIGTGEGAQAYGHGLYFADNRDVAKIYAKALSKSEIQPPDSPSVPTRLSPNDAGSPESAAAGWVGMQHTGGSGQPFYHAWLAAQQSGERPEVLNTLRNWYEQGAQLKDASNTYKVDIPDDAIGNMLHWDAPLSQQPQPAKQLFNDMMAPHVTTQPIGPNLVDVKVGGGTVGSFTPDKVAGVVANPADYVPMTGQDLYRFLGMNESKSSASDKLLAAGVPGIRYLDANSRSLGAGTYNTVLFDDSLATILGRE